MAKLVVVTIAGWCYVDPEGTVIDVASPAEAPEGSACFRIQRPPTDAGVYLTLAEDTRERSEALAILWAKCIAEVRGATGADGKEVPSSRELINSLPADLLMLVGSHVVGKIGAARSAEAEARRKNEPSGTSRGRKSSGGTATKGPRTATPATS